MSLDLSQFNIERSIKKIATDDKTENLQFNFHTFCAVSE